MTAALADGTPLAITAGDDKAAMIWDASAGRLVWHCLLPDICRAIAPTRSGFLISYGEHVAHFQWNDLTSAERGGSAEPAPSPGR
jgi:hypothetical protein